MTDAQRLAELRTILQRETVAAELDDGMEHDNAAHAAAREIVAIIARNIREGHPIRQW